MFQKVLKTPIKQDRAAFREIFLESTERSEILPPDLGGILDLNGPESILPINDEIDFHARTGPPEVNLEPLASFGFSSMPSCWR